MIKALIIYAAFFTTISNDNTEDIDIEKGSLCKKLKLLFIHNVFISERN